MESKEMAGRSTPKVVDFNSKKVDQDKTEPMQSASSKPEGIRARLESWAMQKLVTPIKNLFQSNAADCLAHMQKRSPKPESLKNSIIKILESPLTMGLLALFMLLCFMVVFLAWRTLYLKNIAWQYGCSACCELPEYKEYCPKTKQI